MRKTFLLITALLLVNCAYVPVKPTLFLKATIIKITGCHNFKIKMNEQREVWRGCKLHLRVDYSYPPMILTYQTMGENYYTVGQQVIIGLDDATSKQVISVTPQK